MLAEGLASVYTHPLHQYLGFKFIAASVGCGKLSVPVQENSVNHANIFHGGIIYLACDICALCGLSTLLDEAEEAATHNINVSIMRPAQLGEIVTFQSNVVKRGRTLAFIDVDAFCGERPIASAKVIKSIFRRP